AAIDQFDRFSFLARRVSDASVYDDFAIGRLMHRQPARVDLGPTEIVWRPSLDDVHDPARSPRARRAVAHRERIDDARSCGSSCIIANEVRDHPGIIGMKAAHGLLGT